MKNLKLKVMLGPEWVNTPWWREVLEVLLSMEEI